MIAYKSRWLLSVLAAFSLLLSAGKVAAQDNMITVEIGKLSITHLVFASDLTYVNVASPGIIAAKVVQSSKNILALQALDEFPYTTTISALETNGTMHTFYIRYNSTPKNLMIDTRVAGGQANANVNTQIRPDQPASGNGQYAENPSGGQGNPPASQEPSKGKKNGSQNGDTAPKNGLNVTSGETSNFGRSNAPTIEEVMRKPRNLYHITDKCYGVEAEVINIYAYSDLLYVIISVNNKSDIGYQCNDAQFTVESRKVSSKGLATDKDKWAKSSYGTLSCPPNSKTKMGYTLPKFTLQKNEVFKIYVYEKEGNRNLYLVLDDKDINYAVSPL